MITKAKTTQFITSNGNTCATIEEAKVQELMLLTGGTDTNSPTYQAIVEKSREAISILRLGLPRKPRTVKPKSVKSKKPAVATQPA